MPTYPEVIQNKIVAYQEKIAILKTDMENHLIKNEFHEARNCLAKKKVLVTVVNDLMSARTYL